jgi:hypothetical protein
MTEIEYIEIDNLVIDGTQSRNQQTWGPDESDQQLVESVGEDGVMNPLMVRPVELTPRDNDIDEDYSIVAGSRRFKASVSAGLSSVPCQVIEAGDLEAAITSLKENKERKDLTQTEMMASVKLHYEILGGDELEDEYECDDCGDVFESHVNLMNHASSGASPCAEDVFGQTKDTVRTHEGAVKFIAETHYSDVAGDHARTKVRRMLDAVELPDTYQSLLTDADVRSESEKQKLRDLGIEPEREFSLSNNRAEFDSVVDLYNYADSIDGLDADRCVLPAIGDIDQGQSNRNLSEKIDEVREKFDEEIEGVDSPEEIKKKFNETVSTAREEVEEIFQLQSDGLGTVRLSFDEQKFKRYHALAKQQQKIEHDKEIVKQAYKHYLKDLANKHGW